MAKDSKPEAPPSKPEPEKAQAEKAAPPKPKAARFRWPVVMGSLHCDGVVFGPGDELPLTEEQLKDYDLFEKVERIED